MKTDKDGKAVTGGRTVARVYPDMSPRTLIESSEDKQWLRDVHGITGSFAVAMIFGNEDCPSRVETFSENHYKCAPVVWLRDINNTLIEQV